MAILRESPWYNELVREGLEQGLQQGPQQGRQEGRREERIEMLLLILTRRFGDLPPDLVFRIRALGAEQLRQLVEVALGAPSLDMVVTSLANLPTEPGNGHE